MAKNNKGFNANKFIKDSDECKEHSVEKVIVSKVIDDDKKKKKTGRKKNEIAVVDDAPTTSLSYVQSDMPYTSAYVDTNMQLDDSINQLNVLGNELMSELMIVKNSKTLKNKYNYMNDMTGTLTNIISTKIGAIKEKNKTINDVNNLELKRLQQLKINQGNEDDNTKIMNLYDAFINTPVGVGNTTNVLGPSITDMTIAGGAPDMNRVSIGNDQQLWEHNLSPAENRMVLDAKGLIDTVVFYDETSGNRWFEVIDKNTGQPVPNVEKPDDSYIYELDINTRGGYAKDINRNTTYPLIVVNGGDQSILDY